jgi:hypothetical protein
MFLRNFGKLLPDYTTLHPRKQYLQSMVGLLVTEIKERIFCVDYFTTGKVSDENELDSTWKGAVVALSRHYSSMYFEGVQNYRYANPLSHRLWGL